MKIQLITLTAFATVVVGCETLNTSSLVQSMQRTSDKQTTVVKPSTIADKDTAITTEDKVAYARKEKMKAMMEAQKKQNEQMSKQNEKSENADAKKTSTVEKKPIDITAIKDDKEFFEEFKKVGKADDEKILDRVCKMKDEKLLVEFVGLYPSQANFVALSYASKVKTSELAEILINNINNLSIDSYYEGWNQILGLNYILFDLAKKLDAKARSKYITKAMANREKAVKEGIFVIEKFYIGMPVIDYVMISIEDKHPWVKDKGAVIDWLNYRADMNADIKGKDWRTEWKINDLMFQAVPRYKYFAVKGTLEGLLAFTRKYLDKSAKIQDITLNNGWWLFTDEKNGLKVFLNEESGNLNIQPIE